MEIIVNSEQELEAVVNQLLDFAGDRKILAFTGEIGVGKTTFIKSFCRHFNVNEQVTSPTFSLINEYSYQKGNGTEDLIYHMDLYRLESIEEALHIGIEDYLFKNSFCLIEWPEIIEDILPEDTVRINITIESDSSRKLVFL